MEYPAIFQRPHSLFSKIAQNHTIFTKIAEKYTFTEKKQWNKFTTLQIIIFSSVVQENFYSTEYELPTNKKTMPITKNKKKLPLSDVRTFKTMWNM